MGEKVQGLRSIINRYKMDLLFWGDDKNSIGNEEAKELICTTHGHEGRTAEWKGVTRQGGWCRMGKKWDNCNSIINKIYFLKM